MRRFMQRPVSYSDEASWALITERKKGRLGWSLQTVWKNFRPELSSQMPANQVMGKHSTNASIWLRPSDMSSGVVECRGSPEGQRVHSCYASIPLCGHDSVSLTRGGGTPMQIIISSSWGIDNWRPCLAGMSFVLRVTLVFRPWG